MASKYNEELDKGVEYIVVEIIEYVPNAVLSRTIIKKASGNVTVSSVDAGEELSEKSTPYDNFIQIIDGTAELYLDKKKHTLKLGTGIVIPAHTVHSFNASEQFKMISTIIKSGYDSVGL